MVAAAGRTELMRPRIGVISIAIALALCAAGCGSRNKSATGSKPQSKGTPPVLFVQAAPHGAFEPVGGAKNRFTLTLRGQREAVLRASYGFECPVRSCLDEEHGWCALALGLATGRGLIPAAAACRAQREGDRDRDDADPWPHELRPSRRGDHNSVVGQRSIRR